MDIMDTFPDALARGQGTSIESSEGVGFNNCEPSDLHPNMCYPSNSNSSGAPPAAQFGLPPPLLQQSSSGEADISELYLYSRRVPEVAYTCN